MKLSVPGGAKPPKAIWGEKGQGTNGRLPGRKDEHTRGISF